MVGKYRAYPEYKNSEVEWLGRVPKHWMTTELKRYSSVQGGYAFNSDSFIDSGKAVIRIGDIKQDGSVSLDSCKYIKSENADQYSQYQVHNGDLLMAMTGATIGKAGWFKENESALLNQRVGSFKCNRSHLNYKFFWYVLNSLGYQEYIKLTAFGGAQPNISDSGMVGYQSAFPLANEQEKIASFLDQETAKIDTLIEKQQQLIKLLKEKRQAVISHVVTKGLNPDVPMKDSGVVWLGEVPGHWLVGRYKFCTSRIVVGIAEAATHAYAETGVPIIRSTNIREEGLDTSGMLFIKEEFAEKNDSKYLYANDVITVRTGYPGISAVIPDYLDKSQCFTNLVATPNKNIRPEFLSEYLNSHTGKSYFDLLGWGSAQKNISVPILQNIPIAWPDENEQDEIMTHVNKQRARYTDLVGKAGEQIELLKERRTALISAAVTGKIDVRNWESKEEVVSQ